MKNSIRHTGIHLDIRDYKILTTPSRAAMGDSGPMVTGKGYDRLRQDLCRQYGVPRHCDILRSSGEFVEVRYPIGYA